MCDPGLGGKKTYVGSRYSYCRLSQLVLALKLFSTLVNPQMRIKSGSVSFIFLSNSPGPMPGGSRMSLIVRRFPAACTPRSVRADRCRPTLKDVRGISSAFDASKKRASNYLVWIHRIVFADGSKLAESIKNVAFDGLYAIVAETERQVRECQYWSRCGLLTSAGLSSQYHSIQMRCRSCVSTASESAER